MTTAKQRERLADITEAIGQIKGRQIKMIDRYTICGGLLSDLLVLIVSIDEKIERLEAMRAELITQLEATK